jgi:hypothetical protein
MTVLRPIQVPFATVFTQATISKCKNDVPNVVPVWCYNLTSYTDGLVTIPNMLPAPDDNPHNLFGNSLTHHKHYYITAFLIQCPFYSCFYLHEVS